MKKETVHRMICMILCALGGILIGLNAAYLSNGLNAALFVLGVAFVSMSITIEGLFLTVWKHRKVKK